MSILWHSCQSETDPGFCDFRLRTEKWRASEVAQIMYLSASSQYQTHPGKEEPSLQLTERHCAFNWPCLDCKHRPSAPPRSVLGGGVTYAQRWAAVGRRGSIPPARRSAGWGGRWRWSRSEPHSGSSPRTPGTPTGNQAPGTHSGSDGENTHMHSFKHALRLPVQSLAMAPNVQFFFLSLSLRTDIQAKHMYNSHSQAPAETYTVAEISHCIIPAVWAARKWRHYTIADTAWHIEGTMFLACVGYWK